MAHLLLRLRSATLMLHHWCLATGATLMAQRPRHVFWVQTLLEVVENTLAEARRPLRDTSSEPVLNAWFLLTGSSYWFPLLVLPSCGIHAHVTRDATFLLIPP